MSSPWFTSEFCYEIYWVFSLKASDRGPASSPALIPTSYRLFIVVTTRYSNQYDVRGSVHGSRSGVRASRRSGTSTLKLSTSDADPISVIPTPFFSVFGALLPQLPISKYENERSHSALASQTSLRCSIGLLDCILTLELDLATFYTVASLYKLRSTGRADRYISSNGTSSGTK